MIQMKLSKEKVKPKGNDFNLKKTHENHKENDIFDDESTKMIIIFIYKGYGVKNVA